MRAGELRNRVTIYELKSERRPSGAERKGWVELKTVSCKRLKNRSFTAGGSRDGIDAHEVFTGVRIELVIRMNPSLPFNRSGDRPLLRCKYEGRMYDIDWDETVPEKGETRFLAKLIND